ncbi:MAG: hypothetical protein GF421_06455 [Candidatus Aminicenantes bacterium]|nr:hypothetical protein [Candidatus Aminicenantes bacterium]
MEVIQNVMCFDAELELRDRLEKVVNKDVVISGKEKIRASVFYFETDKMKTGKVYVRLCPEKSVHMKWNDSFTIIDPSSSQEIAKGRVLLPEIQEKDTDNQDEHLIFLKQLNQSEEDMIYALAQTKGYRGLSQKQIQKIARLSGKQILDICQALERERKIRMVSFNPVFIVSRSNLDSLEKDILRLIEKHSRPEEQKKGLSFENLKTKINAHPKILGLTVQYLKHLNRIHESEDRLVLSSLEENLTEEDEKIFTELDLMCSQGEFKKYSFEELQELLGISSDRFERILNVLLKRRKVIHGKEGFIFFSEWLDRLITQLQKSKKRQLTVSEFKKLSGLSRKYAIPLLELLDKKGVTRKQGSIHKIL